MIRRQTALVFLALGSLGAYAFKASSTENIADAADRLGHAMLVSDTNALWEFVPEDERSFYRFDREKFARFWNKMIAPKMKEYDSYRVMTESESGLQIVLTSSRPEMRRSSASLLLSGQFGKYYVPYIVASACFNAAGTNPGEMRPGDYVPFEHYVSWFGESRAQLEALGLAKIRRGPMSQNGLTIDRLQAFCQSGYNTKKAFADRR